MKQILFTLSLLLVASTTIAKPIINSHLRTWSPEDVASSFQLGADLVEIDVLDMELPEFSEAINVLTRFPEKIIAIHLKGYTGKDLPKIERSLEKLEDFWSNLWFFSGDATVDLEIKSKFNLAYITRSTKQDVVSCLRYGLEDEKVFLQSCIEKDIWLRASMMSKLPLRKRFKDLLIKIRDYEKKHNSDPSLIVLDQIDTEKLYCDFVPEFTFLIDGVVTESLSAISSLVLNEKKCP